jgi:hypothetical protein
VRRVEPQRVPLDRPSHAEAEIENILDLRLFANAARAKLVVQIAALQVAVGEVGRDVGAEVVAAALRDDVDVNTARLDLGVRPVRGHVHFLGRHLVDDEGALRHVAAIGGHAVQPVAPVVGEAAMHGQSHGNLAFVAADIVHHANPRSARRHPQGQRGVALERPVRRQ